MEMNGCILMTFSRVNYYKIKNKILIILTSIFISLRKVNKDIYIKIEDNFKMRKTLIENEL